MKASSFKFSIYLIFFFIFFLGLTALFPMTQDEAYYWNWSKDLSFGFFDHPPLVAFLSKMSSFVGESFFHARFFTAFFACMSFYLAWDLYRIFGLSSEQVTKSVLLFSTSFAAFALGIFTTPDSLQIALSVLALREAALAIKGQQIRWLTAGLVTGLGLLSKYMLVLIGPIFLIGLIYQCKETKKNPFLKPWPYLGGVLCFLVFAPHVLWNAQNDFVTFRFQMNHGLSTEHDAYVKESPFPTTRESLETDSGYEFLRPFVAYETKLKEAEKEKTPEKKDEKPSRFFLAIKSFFDFLGGQLGFWGLHLFALISAVLYFRRKKSALLADMSCKGLLLGAAFFPLIFFGGISFFSKVEANWAAMSILGLAPLVGIYTRFSIKKISCLAFIHVIFFSVVACYSKWPLSFSKISIERALKETHGYEELTSYAKAQNLPVFVESYQLVSMMRWYGLENTYQWPHLTRPSYYVFNRQQMDRAFNHYKSSDKFLLIYPQMITYEIEGFKAEQFVKIIDCKEGLYVIPSFDLSVHPSCKPVHVWYGMVYASGS